MTQQETEKASTYTSATGQEGKVGTGLTCPVSILYVPGSSAEEYRDVIEKALEPCWQYGDPDYFPKDVVEKAKSGDVQLWVAAVREDLCGLVGSEVADTPSRRVVRMLYGAGVKMDKWLPPLVARIEEFAEEVEASGVEIEGRRGWVRVLEKYGYTETCTRVKKTWR